MKREESKAFFFEKKKQKTFVHAHLHRCAHRVERAAPIDKSSLVLSLKKERLAFPFLVRA
jgi:hypothetical protein